MKVDYKALTKTLWYPVVKKVAAMLGQEITKQAVSSAVTKVVPVLGGVVAGTLTYATFRPMGQRLTDVCVQNLNGEFSIKEDLRDQLNSEFLQELEEKEVKVIDGEVVEDQVTHVQRLLSLTLGTGELSDGEHHRQSKDVGEPTRVKVAE